MKTVVVIGLLSMVMYGVYTVLTEPDPLAPQALENKPAGSSPVDLGEPFLEERFESAFDETPPSSTSSTLRDSALPGESLDREPVPIDPTAGGSDPAPAKPNADFQTGVPEIEAVAMADSFASGPAAGVPTVDGSPRRVTPATISADGQRQQLPMADAANAGAPEVAAETAALDSHATVVEPLDTEQSVAVAAGSQSALGAPEQVLPETAARMFEVQWGEAQERINKGRFRAALAGLSKYFNHDSLSSEQHARLLGLLDPLAGKVVYSAEHLILPMHKVRQHETLADIAARYQVPWQLLQNINAVRNPAALVPGTELKVVPGPFRAEIDLGHGELAVFVGDLYAGRFVFASGSDPSPSPGEYVVKEKRRQRDYVGIDGKAWPATDPENPYGQVWLDLGQRICIHGSPLTATSNDLPTGCISLAPRDANDVFAILSAGSRVRIHR
ncbi:MAG: LysM peptidoglycan-binding domain-containing protein [Planctomycetota bacterium]|nr:LysM peptidoglycan-binding domain-containing protein [Planctomycetota bacterium]